jgi:proline racemase
MEFNRRVTIIDAHNAGEPMRLVTGGIPFLKGESMAEKQEYFINNYDYIREFVMCEPRGHSDMFGGVMCAPSLPEADLGIIFFDAGNYYHMCGHGAMAIAKIAVETGMIRKKEGFTEVILDTSAGPVKLLVNINKGKVSSVRMLSNPAFLYKRDIRLRLADSKDVNIDIAFGGNFFALVDVSQFDIHIDQKHINFFLKKGMEIINSANLNLEIEHPLEKHINQVTDIMFYELLAKNTGKNVVVLGQGQYDRSPCGTGTTSRLAMMYQKGEIGLKEKFIHRSIIDSEFTAWVERKLTINGLEAVEIAIESKPQIIGFSEFVSSEDDEFKNGFLVKRV